MPYYNILTITFTQYVSIYKCVTIRCDNVVYCHVSLISNAGLWYLKRKIFSLWYMVTG